MSDQHSFKAEDLKIDTFRRGTNVSEAPCGVRITHLPTGVSVTETEGTATENRMMALGKLGFIVNQSKISRLEYIIKVLLKDMNYNSGLTNMWLTQHSDQVEEVRADLADIWHRIVV